MTKLNHVAAWAVWPILLLLVGALSMRFGIAGGTWADVLDTLTGTITPKSEIIRDYRLARVVAGSIVGLHFAIAGLIMQTVLRNPLADPTIFGISGGASMAVVAAMSLALTLFPSTHFVTVSDDYLPLAWVPHVALIGGLLATALVFLLSWDNGISAKRIVLNGVIIGAVLNALVMALVLSLSEERTVLAILWLAGSLYARNFSNLWPALPWTFVGLCLTVYFIKDLSALRFDRNTATSIGLPVARTQVILVLVAAGLAASAVSIAGPVGFVGLLAPHIARMFSRGNLPYFIWTSAFVGALLVVGGDAIGRLVLMPTEVPVGIMTSLLGAPLFAYLLTRPGKKS